MARSLRDYQRACGAAIDQKLSAHRSTLAVLSTGLGKTVIMSDAARRWSQRGYVLCLAHRVELLDQAAAKFEPDLGYAPAIIQAGRDIDGETLDGGKRVIVGSVQTLTREKRLSRLRQMPMALVMIDEAHHATARSYRLIVDYLCDLWPQCKVLGVTATPRRSDKKALGIVFESEAYKMESGPAIEGGWLVEPIEERVTIDGIDFEKIKLGTNEEGETDFDQATLEALMLEERPLQAVAVPLLEKSKEGRKSLVFTSGVQHAHILAGILNRERQGSAIAIDGTSTPPGHPRREQAIRDFSNGSLQYLCNFGVFTEGFDSPACSMVTIARPTKSLTVLIQMIGRGLRPLPGVVDGHQLPAVRRAAIAESGKPSALVLYFVPKAANIKTVTTYDALAGNFDDDDEREKVVALAKEMSQEKPNAKALETLKQATALYRLLAEDEARKKIKAKVEYRTERIGEYAPDAMGENVSDTRRGGASDKQIQMLLDLGVSYATAAAYQPRQASAVIDSLRRERCTVKQRRILEKYGESHDVNFHEARKIIDEIVANGWQPRKVTA